MAADPRPGAGGSTSGARRRDLRPLLRPRSIALVGASRNLDSLNGRPLTYLKVHGYAGQVYPVNPGYDSIADLPCYPSLEALPERPDLVVVGVAAPRVLGVLEQCVALGIPAAIVFASGYAEMGEAGRAAQAAIGDLAARTGLLVCGPNTLGLLNAQEGVAATFTQVAATKLPRGPIAFVTQSGAFGTALAALADRQGIYFDYFINTGNEAALRFSEYVAEVLEDPDIRVVAGYVEGLQDADRFLEVARHALDLGKPIVLAKVGRFGSGQRAAASHTGSLAGSDAVYDAVLRQAGVVRAYDEEELLDTVALFASYQGPLPRGRRIGLVTHSGGAGVLMADRCEELGLAVPELEESTQRRLRELVPPFAGVANPVDITAQFIADPRLLEGSLAAVAADPAVDVVVFYLGVMTGAADDIVARLTAASQAIDKPLVVAWAAAPDHAVRALRSAGVPTLPTATRAINGLANFVRYAEMRHRILGRAVETAMLAPPPTAERVRAARPVTPRPGQAVPDGLAREVLAAYGARFPREVLATSAADARRAAEAIGYSVALKLVSPTLLHKTEAGALALHLRDGDEVEQAYETVVGNARAHDPDLRVEGVLVQEMVADPGGVEVLVGVSHDPQFGPVVAFGLGGIHVELLRDVALRAAPLTEAEAREMVGAIRGARLLEGFRGRPRTDVDALVHLLVGVSRMAAELRGTIAEVDLNPVLVLPEGRGAFVLDRLMTWSAA